MIHVDLYISKYDWLVHCYFAVSHYFTNSIVESLRKTGAGSAVLLDSRNKLLAGKLNGGINYSNYDRRESVLVTELTSSAAEFLDSFVHETGHLATHIAIADGIDLKGEEVRYIQGDIARALYPYCSRLLCDHCRN